MSYQLSFIRKNRPLLLAGAILLQTTPAFAQIGQSDWVTPGAPDADTTAIGNSAPPSTGATFMNGLNPGTGWTPSQLTQPGARFQKKMGAPPVTPTAGQVQQPIMAPVDTSGGQGWADASAQQAATQFQPQQAAPTPTQIGQSDWISPSGGGSALPVSNGKSTKVSSSKPGQSDWVTPGGGSSGGIGQSALITPGGGSSYNTGFGTASPDLGGYVSQTQPFNPGTSGGGMANMNPNGGMNPMGNMGGMNQMGNMGGMNQMGNMGAMNQMGNMGAMNQMGNMGAMNQMGGANTTNMNLPYNAGGSGAMGGMGGMGGMMGGMGGDAGSPMDALGKAIAGAAAMGLIPSSGDKNLQTGGGSFGGTGGDIYRTKSRGNGIGNAINHVPGVRLTKDVHRSVNRAVKRNIDRNINYAINQGMRRAVRKAIWRY